MQELRDVLKKWIYGLSPVFKNELIGSIFVLAYPIMGFIMHFTYWNFYYNWLSAVLFFAYQIGFLLCFADEKDIFLSIATGIYALTSLLDFVSNQYFTYLVSLCVYGFLAFFFLKCYLRKTVKSHYSYFESVQKENQLNGTEIDNPTEEQAQPKSMEGNESLKMQKNFCSNCGAKLVSGAAFCNMCGAKQSNNSGIYDRNSMAGKEKELGYKVSQMKNKLKGYAVLAILLILMIGGFIYFVFGSGGLKGKYYYYSTHGILEENTYIELLSNNMARGCEEGIVFSCKYKKNGNVITVESDYDVTDFYYTKGKLYVGSGGPGSEWRKKNYFQPVTNYGAYEPELVEPVVDDGRSGD